MDLDTIKQHLIIDVNLKIEIAFWTLIIFIVVHILNSGLNIIPFIGSIPQVRGIIINLQAVAFVLLILLALSLKYPHKPNCIQCGNECKNCSSIAKV